MKNSWVQSLGEDVIQVIFPSQSDGDGTTITLIADEESCHCQAGRILGDLIMLVESPAGEMTTKMSILEGETIYDAVLKAVQIAKNHNVAL